MMSGRPLATLVLLLAVGGAAVAGIGDIPVARPGEALPVTAKWNLAVDDLTVKSQRQLEGQLGLPRSGRTEDDEQCYVRRRDWARRVSSWASRIARQLSRSARSLLPMVRSR